MKDWNRKETLTMNQWSDGQTLITERLTTGLVLLFDGDGGVSEMESIEAAKQYPPL